MLPPIAERHSKDVLFGKVKGEDRGDSKFLMNPPIKKRDYYYWLRDDSRKNKKVLTYLEEENKYGDYMMNNLGVTVEKNKILAELKKNLIEDYDTLELPEGQDGFLSQFRFYRKFVKGKSYPIYYYRLGDNHVKYMDPNELNNSGTLDVTSPIFSPSLNMVGYGIDNNGSEKYEIKLFKFPSMEKIEHKIPKLLYATFILTDDTVFYLEEDDSNRPCILKSYSLLDGAITQIYEEKNIENQLQIDMGDDFKSLFYTVENYNQNETRILWFNGPRKGQNVLVKPMSKNIEYMVEIFGDYFILIINSNGCKNFTIKYCKIGSNRFYDLIKYDDKVYIEYINTVKGGIILECRKNGEQYFRHLEIGDKMKIKNDRNLMKKSGGYLLCISYTHPESSNIIYSYQSLIIPQVWYNLNIEKLTQIQIKTTKTKIDLSKYKVRRCYVKSGIYKIPVDLLMLKNVDKGRVLLYGYNSYGSNVEMSFDEKLFPLVDRGFIYAIANTRGSSYLGKDYYLDGMMMKKINTFKDFIKVSEYLRNNFCEKDGLSIEGRSAGGLLVGAVSVMRPDLYQNVIAGVPFVDVLVSMSDSSIPLTTGEWTQWGNPNIRKYYNYMSKYSPIDNIKEGICYPNYYINSGLNDPRVAYWEPTKFVAKLRYSINKDCKSIIVLKINLNSGHFTSRDRYKNLTEIAEKYAFLIKN